MNIGKKIRAINNTVIVENEYVSIIGGLKFEIIGCKPIKNTQITP